MVQRERRALQKQRSFALWFTGLSGAGKSTIAGLLNQRLIEYGRLAYVLDGDNIRRGLTRDLGFSAADRAENIRRIAEVACLMVDAGVIVIVAFISPFRADRQMARRLMKEGDFIEVFIDTPLDVAEQRDPKGLYKRARRGEIKDFTGLDSPYEPPEHADIRIDTTSISAEQAVDEILGHLLRHGLVLPR